MMSLRQRFQVARIVVPLVFVFVVNVVAWRNRAVMLFKDDAMFVSLTVSEGFVGRLTSLRPVFA